MKKRLICAVLLAVMLVSCIPSAMAMSTQEKESSYVAAIRELEAYLESNHHAPDELEPIRAAFDELAQYRQSNSFKYYAIVLMRVENNEFGTSTDLYLDMLDSERFNKALEDLPDTPIGTAQELAAYVHGRECEYQGDTETACEYYAECKAFYDASDRYLRLENERIEKTYQEAVALFDAGRYEGARELFQEVGKYHDSGLYLDMIATELAHVWVEADCMRPRTCLHCGKTEGKPLGHDWRDATCTMPPVCNRCFQVGGEKLGHDWQQAAPAAPKVCNRCGREQNRFFLGLDNCYTEGDAVALCDAILHESKGKYTEENYPRTMEEAQMLFGVDFDTLDCAAECVLHGVISSESVNLKDFFSGEWGAYYSHDITFDNRYGDNARDSFIEYRGTIEEIIQAMGDFSRDKAAVAWFWKNQINVVFYFEDGMLYQNECIVYPAESFQDEGTHIFYLGATQYVYFSIYYALRGGNVIPSLPHISMQFPESGFFDVTYDRINQSVPFLLVR